MFTARRPRLTLVAALLAALTLGLGSVTVAEGARRKKAAVSKKGGKKAKAARAASKSKARGKRTAEAATTKVMTFAADDVTQPGPQAQAPATTTTELALSSGTAQVRRKGSVFLIAGTVSRDELRQIQKRVGSKVTLSVEGEVTMDGEAAALVDAGKVDRLVREIEGLR